MGHKIEPLPSSYKVFWGVLFASLAAWAWWENAGAAWVRRTWFLPAVTADSARTEPYFVALIFPRIMPRPGPYAFSRDEFEEILRGLKSLDYHPIGAEDIRALYFEHRLLPPRAVLIGLDRDDPLGVELADSVLRKLRFKGAVFLNGGDHRGGLYARQWLSAHAVAQMKKSGAWDVGKAVSSDPAIPAKEFVLTTAAGELRFFLSPTGFNDDRQDPRELNILLVRPGKPAVDAILQVHKSQPRQGEFVDKFDSPRWDREWVAGWGALSSGRRRLVLIPLPGQTGAAVYLSGTESWRDLVLEFELERFKKGFWAYARYKDSSHYLRLGATEEGWLLQQRRGPFAGPALLGKAAFHRESLPARVRLVVKADAVLLYINGALQFGKAVRLDPSVDFGRVELAVHDKERRAAVAALTSVRVKPLGGKWIVLDAGAVSPDALGRLRSEAVEASFLSPRWFRVSPDGALASSAVGQRELLWSFAGYYACRLAPAVDLTSWRDDLATPAGTARLAEELVELARREQTEGYNVVLTQAQSARAEPFLAALRRGLGAQGRRLWVTRPGAAEPAWAAAVDGVLRPAAPRAYGMQLMESTALREPARGDAAAAEIASSRRTP